MVSARPSEDFASVGVSPAEDRAIRNLVKKFPLPSGVRSFEIKYGKDSTGNPALWVRFIIDEGLAQRAHSIPEWNSLRRNVQGELLRSNLKFWPYVEFRASA
jgi:hypothetical protein